MATIKLDYNQNTQMAIIQVRSECSLRQWGSVRRLFEERSDSTTVHGQKLELPWWEFLAFRDGFKFVLRSNGINVEVGIEAKILLEKSVKKENAFKRYGSKQGESSDINEENIDQKLLDRGF